MKKYIFLFIVLLFFSLKKSTAQSKFDIVGDRKSVTIPFKFVNNLILIPIQLNGKELTFILDTGVSKSLLFNVASVDSIQLNKTEKIKVKGLGENKYFDAIKSNNNILRIKNVISPNFEIYMILDVEFDFSARIGININGLIGTDLLKDFVVEINYIRKKIRITKHEKFKFNKIKKCKKCEEFDLIFQHRKPYLETSVSTENGEEIPVTLLVDSGSSDSIWLFENSDERIVIPKKNINEFLGRGLSGNIFGKKAKIANFNVRNYHFKNIITAYPDSTSIFLFNKNIKRNGTIGSEILRRFCVIFDYKNKKMILKKNQNFRTPFFYDKSGLEIIHNGKMLVKEDNVISTFGAVDDGTPIISIKYKYVFRNSYMIALVKPNSPAASAGLKEDDIILEVNGKPVYEFNLHQLIHVFATNEGKRIRMLIDRNGFQYSFEFKLKDML